MAETSPQPRVGPVSPIPHPRPGPPPETPKPVPARAVIVPEIALPALSRPVSFDSRGRPVAEAVRRWSEDAGVNVALHPGLFPGSSTGKFPLWLKVHRMPAKAALEWMCRLCDASYAVVENGIWIVPDYRWVSRLPIETRIDLVGGLYAARGRDLENYLHQSLRVFLDHHPACRLSLHPESGQLLTALPPEAYNMVRSVLRELESHAPFRSPRDQLPSLILLPEESSPAQPLVTGETLRRRMPRIMRVFYQDTDIQDILADIIDRTEVNIALDYRAVPESRRRLTLSLGYVTAEALLHELVRRSYLKRLVLEPERGLWIYPESQVSDHPKTLHLAWQRVVFRSYPARDLAVKKAGTGSSAAPAAGEAASSAEKLIAYVMEKTGAEWRDPAYAIGYNEPTGRLLVQHEIETHRLIPGILDGYRRSLKLLLSPPVRLRPPGAEERPKSVIRDQ